MTHFPTLLEAAAAERQSLEITARHGQIDLLADDHAALEALEQERREQAHAAGEHETSYGYDARCDLCHLGYGPGEHRAG